MKAVPYFKSPTQFEECPRVMVVEDHADTRFMLRTILERRGLSVVEAEDGEEAIRLAERDCPRLILMDMGLPRMDGLATTRRIRAHAALNQVPIIFLSGHTSATHQMDARDAGCDEFLVKPIDIDQLYSALKRHLEEKKV
ncbi:MAG TPA: response regulator [Pyrinomonadaceae bacterium]|nr:response regulator [Pyrinomonadaceae bacterium]